MDTGCSLDLSPFSMNDSPVMLDNWNASSFGILNTRTPFNVLSNFIKWENVL